MPLEITWAWLLPTCSGNPAFTYLRSVGILLVNIKSLFMVENDPGPLTAGDRMKEVNTLEDAWLLTDGDTIADFGTGNPPAEGVGRAVDCNGGMVLPAFCDSHTHLVYAGSRERKFEDRIRGLSYEEIARRGGGILHSAERLSGTTEDELYEQAFPRVQEIMRSGTGAVEIKSGYGLNTENELKMLRVIRRLREDTPLSIRSTFLGAHAIPSEFRSDPDKFVEKVIGEMIPAVAREGLADYVDVFCDRGFFTEEQTGRILDAAGSFGLIPKIHANELDLSGGIQVGVAHGALSVDHLEHVGDEEIRILKESHTMPTLLPGASFFLGLGYAPARALIDAGLPVALASDYNPGSSPTGNMELILSLGVIQMKMLPFEALHATTLNGAYAMGIEATHGTITKGKRANLIITKPMPGFSYMAYSYGTSQIDRVLLNGIIQDG
jgi:imidazolonepropionase